MSQKNHRNHKNKIKKKVKNKKTINEESWEVEQGGIYHLYLTDWIWMPVHIFKSERINEI